LLLRGMTLVTNDILLTCLWLPAENRRRQEESHGDNIEDIQWLRNEILSPPQQQRRRRLVITAMTVMTRIQRVRRLPRENGIQTD
jgi:hypothetical protein